LEVFFIATGRRISIERRAVGEGRTRGTMLWFNEEKDSGALRTDQGDRLDVSGTAFLPGEKPTGRCAGRAVEFETLEGDVSSLAFIEDSNPRRARLRRSR
jgi:hypothetical protein